MPPPRPSSSNIPSRRYLARAEGPICQDRDLLLYRPTLKLHCCKGEVRISMVRAQGDPVNLARGRCRHLQPHPTGIRGLCHRLIPSTGVHGRRRRQCPLIQPRSQSPDLHMCLWYNRILGFEVSFVVLRGVWLYFN